MSNSIGTRVDEVKPPRVEIDPMVKLKIMHWVNASDFEVSGLGKIVVENGTIRVIDAILLPQKNTSASTDIEPEDVGKAMFLLRETPGELRFWWHSHVNMGVFWSGTDMDTIRKLGEPGWFVNTVFNKRWETRTAIYIGQPFPVFLDNLTLEEHREQPSEELKASWNQEYELNVQNYKRSATVYRGGQPSVGENWSRLSKKERKRLAKLRKIGGDDTGKVMGTSNDDAPEVEEPQQGDFMAPETRTLIGNDPRCLICEMRSVGCNCPYVARARAEALDDFGICWSCCTVHSECVCTTEDFTKERDWFISESHRLYPNGIDGSTLLL